MNEFLSKVKAGALAVYAWGDAHRKPAAVIIAFAVGYVVGKLV